jgi:hypothetical protein
MLKKRTAPLRPIQSHAFDRLIRNWSAVYHEKPRRIRDKNDTSSKGAIGLADLVAKVALVAR